MGDTFYLIVGLCGSLIGIILVFCILLRIIKCRYKVTGTVKKLIKESFIIRGSTVYKYRPMLVYEYNGRKLEVKASFRNKKNKYKEGDLISFRISKANPTDVVFKNIYFTLFLSILFLALGALLVVLYFI